MGVSRSELLARLPAEVRGRVPWIWVPLVALVAAAAAYVLHHASWFAEHRFLVAAFVIVAAAALAVAAGLVARPAERLLPMVVALEPETTDDRPAGRGDLGFCAALHAETLAHGFFASLGHGFLRAYYATFVDSPYAVALLATARGAPIGLVAGPLEPRAHARWVLRHRGVRLAVRGAAALLVRPRVALRFVRTRVERYRGAWRRARGTASQRSPEAIGTAVLTHVAILPGVQRAGVGERLVWAFVDAARSSGAEQIVLTTLDGPAGAAGFYRRLGWRLEDARETFDGTRVLTFVLEVPSLRP